MNRAEARITAKCLYVACALVCVTLFGHCKARLRPPPLSPPVELSLTSLLLDKTTVSDNDVVTLSFSPSADCDFIVSASAVSQSATTQSGPTSMATGPAGAGKVVARGAAPGRTTKVVSIAAKNLFVGDNSLVVTVVGSDTTVAAYSVKLTFRPSQVSISIQTAPDGCAAPFTGGRLNGASSTPLFAALCSVGGVYVGAATGATAWTLGTSAMGTLTLKTGATTVFVASNTPVTSSITAADGIYPAATVSNVSISPVVIRINDCTTPLTFARVHTGRTLLLNALRCDVNGKSLGGVSVAWSTTAALGSFAPVFGESTTLQATNDAVGADTISAIAAPFTSGSAALVVDWAVQQWTTYQIEMNELWTKDGAHGPKATLTSTRPQQPAVMVLDFFESDYASDLAKSPNIPDGYTTYHSGPPPSVGRLIDSDADTFCITQGVLEPTEQVETQSYNVIQWWSVSAALSGLPGGSLGLIGKASLVRGADAGERNPPPLVVAAGVGAETPSVHDLVLRNERQTNGQDSLQGSGAVAKFTVPLSGTYALSNVWARRMAAGGDDTKNDLRSAEFRVFSDPDLQSLCSSTVSTACKLPLADIDVGDPTKQKNDVTWKPNVDSKPFHLDAGQNLYFVATRRDGCSASYDVTQVTADITVVVD